MNEAVDNNAPINQGVDMYGRQKPDLLSPRECAIIAAQAANEKKATDIMVQQVGDLIGVTEYFVICTASNNRQVDAVVDEIEEQYPGWRSLLQLDCNDDWNLQFYDCGMLCFLTDDKTVKCYLHSF